MKNVQLKFDTIHHLWRFKEEVRANTIEIITNDLLLICELTEQQVQLAVQKFDAVVQKELNTNYLNQ